MHDANPPQHDALVASAIHHWAPRFVTNGVPLTDFQEVTAGISRWADWCRAWSARAAVHEGIGRQALADSFNLSAGQHLNTAAVCYHFAKFVFVLDVNEMRAAHMKAIECRKLALPHLRPPGEYVRIPFDGKSFAGVLRRPAGAARAPIVVMCMGLDSAKEEMDSYESLFLARGLATLSFDGPGQGESEYDIAIRGDYEVAVKAVVDWVEKRQDVDSGHIGLWGVSLGGYYAPRAAAMEPRFAACVAWGGHWDYHESWV
ncbi:MAG TPA: alpha/beta hydrolase, partial [Burkholderiales bacterium]|nr:alpha/beta hydrolase [Burkholderiales bacterium]